jgi:hypothetical protein
MKAKSPREQLEGFIDKFTPEIAARARDVLEKMRVRLPGATELVYDNAYALVIGFCPGERASDVIFSVVVNPRYISLCFFEGDTLPDPNKLLQGSGNVARHIRLETPEKLDDPAVKALMKAALAAADERPDPKQPQRIIIRAVSKNQRPRRPVKAKL